jgi:hypothetical protein
MVALIYILSFVMYNAFKIELAQMHYAKINQNTLYYKHTRRYATNNTHILSFTKRIKIIIFFSI